MLHGRHPRRDAPPRARGSFDAVHPALAVIVRWQAIIIRGSLLISAPIEDSLGAAVAAAAVADDSLGAAVAAVANNSLGTCGSCTCAPCIVFEADNAELDPKGGGIVPAPGLAALLHLGLCLGSRLSSTANLHSHLLRSTTHQLGDARGRRDRRSGGAGTVGEDL